MEEKRALLKLSQEENTYLVQDSYGELLVGEKGHRPMELLLIALAGCSGVDISHILRKKRQEIKDIEIVATGIRKEEHPRVYEKIKLLYRVYGKNVREKAVEEALRLSLGKYCSVYAMLSKACEIEMNFEVINEA
ncbi:MAG: OsmC family protein [Aquificaceae bacterium]